MTQHLNVLDIEHGKGSSNNVQAAFSIMEQERMRFEQNRKKSTVQEIRKVFGTDLDLSRINGSGMDDVLRIVQMTQEYERVTKQEVEKRNRCSFSEYQRKWLSLHSLLDKNDPDYDFKARERQALSLEFQQTFLQNYPIIIYDDNDPEKVLCEIPPQVYSINSIVGQLAASSLDTFDAGARIERKDIEYRGLRGLIKSFVESQGLTDTRVRAIRANMFMKNLQVLRVFNPNHPLLKQVDEIEKELDMQEIPKNTKVEVKDNDAVIIDDNSNIDLF